MRGNPLATKVDSSSPRAGIAIRRRIPRLRMFFESGMSEVDDQCRLDMLAQCRSATELASHMVVDGPRPPCVVTSWYPQPRWVRIWS